MSLSPLPTTTIYPIEEYINAPSPDIYLMEMLWPERVTNIAHTPKNSPAKRYSQISTTE